MNWEAIARAANGKDMSNYGSCNRGLGKTLSFMNFSRSSGAGNAATIEAIHGSPGRRRDNDDGVRWKRKYRWVWTWPAEEDWSAFHDGLWIGRVSRDKTSLKHGTFMWSGNCSEWPGFQRSMPHSGRTVEAWEAAKAVDDWYAEGLARTGERPAIVALNIGHLDEDGLPRRLRD